MDFQFKLGVEGKSKIANPGWEQIYEALLRLDGTHITQVLLESSNRGSLFAGGGDDMRYIVTYFADDSYVLTDPALTGPNIKLTVQTSAEFPARWCVKLQLVLKVFEHFFRTGELPKDVRWEIDDYSGVEVHL